ncbi:MAG: hypothetical protein AB1456_07700, partial [Thermodesulfobacteriota bacterium]
RFVAGGAAGHSDHGRDLIEVLEAIVEGKTEDYRITDEAKLRRALAGAITAAGTYTPLGIVHNGTTLTMVGPLPAPITITTQAPSIDIAFDTSEGLGSADVGGLCALFPAPPDVVITLN